MELEFTDNKLKCSNNGKLIFIKKFNGNFIYDNDYILIMNKKKNKATLFDYNGNIVASIFNNDKINLISSFKDKYGLYVKVLLKENNKWNEHILTHRQGYFRKIIKNS